MNGERGESPTNASSASGIGGTARSVEVPEVEPPRSGIVGATDGPKTSPPDGRASESKKRPLFAGQKRRPGEGKITRTAEGCVFEMFYDEKAIERVAQRAPWLLPELMAELERNRK